MELQKLSFLGLNFFYRCLFNISRLNRISSSINMADVTNENDIDEYS